jgi:hypothetical protein
LSTCCPPVVHRNGNTGEEHLIVDGYTGLNQNQVSDEPQGMHIVPIVQTNNEWNTHLRIANFGEGSGLTPFTVTIYESFGPGATGGSVGEFTGTFRPGDVASFDIMEHPAIEPGFVGMARLGRAVLAHLAVTGTIAMGETLIQQIVGHGLAARLSARLGEGVVNGMMTARIGIAAMDVCRPRAC